MAGQHFGAFLTQSGGAVRGFILSELGYLYLCDGELHVHRLFEGYRTPGAGLDVGQHAGR